MNGAQVQFIANLNDYVRIHATRQGSDQQLIVADILRRMDRPNRRRRYLATHPRPSIDEYIDFCHAQRGSDLPPLPTR